MKLRGIKPKDFDANVRLESAHGKIENEFDALVVSRHRLLVIECKTSQFGRNASRDANYVYKLTQLSRGVGGIMSRSLLLSARDVMVFSDALMKKGTRSLGVGHGFFSPSVRHSRLVQVQFARFGGDGMALRSAIMQ